MNRISFSSKRQLLADLFTGKTSSLHAFKAINQQQVETLYRWIVTDEIAGTVYGVSQEGSQHPLTTDDLTEAPLNIIWRIVDHSGNTAIPEPDEEY